MWSYGMRLRLTQFQYWLAFGKLTRNVAFVFSQSSTFSETIKEEIHQKKSLG